MPGPLRVTAALFNAGLIASSGAKVAMITSQGGSIAWRDVQNGESGPFDYGPSLSPRRIYLFLFFPGRISFCLCVFVFPNDLCFLRRCLFVLQDITCRKRQQIWSVILCMRLKKKSSEVLQTLLVCDFLQMGKLLSLELKSKGVAVYNLHPGKACKRLCTGSFCVVLLFFADQSSYTRSISF